MSDLQTPTLGTLVWIGDPMEPLFREPLAHCLGRVGQVAFRTDLADAIGRPAAGVQHVIVARTTCDGVDAGRRQRLADCYPEASVLELLGTLCEGERCGDPIGSPTERCYWHRWNQILPRWLSGSVPAADVHGDTPVSLAVLSSTYDVAQPLLELADSAGSTAIWCGQRQAWRVRNVDVVWWDDSAAAPTSPESWRRRLETFAGQRPVRHAWIANAPRPQQVRQAVAGGIELIVSKPNRIDGLLSMFVPPKVRSTAEPLPLAA